MSFEIIRWTVLLMFAFSAGLILQAWWIWLKAASVGGAVPLLTRGEELSEQRRQLAQAGFTSPDAVGNLQRAKLLSGLLLGGLGFWLAGLLVSGGTSALILKLCFSGGLGLAGVFLPTIYVDRRRKAWRKRIRNGVPDALDFMQVCMEAGQSVDAALKRVTEELEGIHPDLAGTFRRLSEALAAGATRRAAFEQLAHETENDDLRQFATIMEQVTSMGASVTHTLRTFTADLRDQRIRATEAKANVLPTKMTLGSMMFTVPPMLIVLLAPAALQIMEAF